MADEVTTIPPRRGGTLGGFLAKAAGILVLLALAALLILWVVQRYVAARLSPDPTTIASASLEGLREQNRLSAFAARYVAVVTSREVRTRSSLSTVRASDIRRPGSICPDPSGDCPTRGSIRMEPFAVKTGVALTT